MKDFLYEEGGDFSVRWHPSKTRLFWDRREGAHFFLARWQSAAGDYGLLGLSHPGVGDQKQAIHRLAAEVTRAVEEPESPLRVEGALRDVAGWGLAVRDARGLRVYRDPIGRLPLVLRKLDEGEYAPGVGVVVGTRPDMVMGANPRVRRQRLDAFLRDQSGQGRDDFFEGLLRIRAGELLVAERTGRLRFRNYWPGSSLTPYEGGRAAERVRDALASAIEGAASRGGELVSLSGGYDSTLLLLLFQEFGKHPRAISMVAEGTVHFSERDTIEDVLSSRHIDGEFFDIGGPQQWGTPEVHHPVVGFGPAFMAEAAYFKGFYAHIRDVQQRQGKPPVVVTGLGADQLFYLSEAQWVEDQLWQGGRPAAVGSWGARCKRRIKAVAKRLGLDALPVYSKARPGPPWMPAKKSGRTLQWRVLYDRPSWYEQRVAYFRSWRWEYTTRLMERYRRGTGLFVELPFLDLEVLRVGLSLPPSSLRARGELKAPLRTLLEERITPTFFEDRRLGCFDEIIWKGVFDYLRPTPEALSQADRLADYSRLDRDKLREALAANRRRSDVLEIQHGHALWHLLAAQLWLMQLTE